MPNTYKIITIRWQQHEVWDRNNDTIFTGPDNESCKKYIKEQKKEDERYRKLNKSFEISEICREDLIEYIGEEQTLKLSNIEMKQIARLMKNYMQDDYWNSLKETLNNLNIKTI
jgi:hypothetical protein